MPPPLEKEGRPQQGRRRNGNLSCKDPKFQSRRCQAEERKSGTKRRSELLHVSVLLELLPEVALARQFSSVSVVAWHPGRMQAPGVAIGVGR